MCQSCAHYREHGAQAVRCPDDIEFPSSLSAPMSRRRMLRLLGGGLAAGVAGGLLTRQDEAAAATAPYVVLIVLDGGRPEYLQFSGLPNLRRLINSGTQYTTAFTGILESETPSGHVTIATGWEPQKTGIPSFWWATGGTRYSLFDPKKIRAGDMERLVKQAGVPTIAGLVHASSPTARVVALSGSKYYAADAIGGPNADVTMYFRRNLNGHFVPTYIPGHQPPLDLIADPTLSYLASKLPLGVENHLTMALAVQSFQRLRQQVTLINLPEFDWPLGHVDGGVLSPNRAETLMRGFDHDLGMLMAAYDSAGVLNRTVFVIMADHGMMPLRHRIDESDLRSAVAKAGATIVAQAYTSGVFFWLREPQRAVAAAQQIAALKNPLIQNIYTQTSGVRGGSYRRVSGAPTSAALEAANQALLRSFNGPRAPHLVLSLAEGVGVEPGGQANWKADHGGTSWQAQHFPLILSGPGVRKGYVSTYPARLIDVAPSVLSLMGIRHDTMQGIALADAMTNPPSWAAQHLKTQRSRLLPLVAAMQQQSRHDLSAGL